MHDENGGEMESTQYPAKSNVREVLLLVGLFVAGAVAVVGYSHFTRAPAGAALRSDTSPLRTALPSAPRPDATRSPPPISVSQIGSTARNGDASDDEPEQRAAAIEALGRAPLNKAIPALQKVIKTTADETEWRAALRTLGTLAESQGDPDETIRNGLRDVISHTSNEALILGAQETLDAIDRAAFEAATGRPATPDIMRGAVPPEGTSPSPPPTD